MEGRAKHTADRRVDVAFTAVAGDGTWFARERERVADGNDVAERLPARLHDEIGRLAGDEGWTEAHGERRQPSLDLGARALAHARIDENLGVDEFEGCREVEHGHGDRGPGEEAAGQLSSIVDAHSLHAEPAMVLKGAGWITPEDLELAPLPDEGATVEVAGTGEHGDDSEHDRADLASARGLPDRAAQGEVRRADLVARCRVSHELARRALAGLGRLELLRRVGLARATRYVSLSFWLTFLDDAAEVVLSLV